MTWEGFWLPNLLQVTVFAAFGLLFRRWFGGLLRQIFGEQQQTKALAKTAATHSLEAVEQARNAAQNVGDASESARTAADSARATNEAVVWLATELGKANDRSEVLAEKTNRLVAALARERARQPTDGSDEHDGLTVTGRHRLHTTLINTGQLTEPDLDPVQEQPW